MTTQLMNLPINIPWKLIAASPDMLDTKFCSKQFPFAWRSSIAISVWEPKLEDLPEELCDERLTYLKVTCSITGYQASKEETDLATDQYLGSAEFSNIPTEQVERVMNEYFACYGVLLNVAVFPTPEYEYYLEEFKNISFDELQKITELPNPFEFDGVVFNATGQPHNRTVDQYPQGGNGKPELDLFTQMEVTFPLSMEVTLPLPFEVRAAIVHYSSERVIMKAYKGNQFIGQQIAGLEEGQVHDLKISKEGGIDRIVFEAPGNKACLLGLSLYHRMARPKEVTIEKLPRIIDFEPKTRDLYQAATESGEVLTASVSGIKTDKSFTHTESSETGISLGAEIGGAVGPVSFKGNAGLAHKWGETDQDSRSTQTDASRERRESQSTTTNLNQMYNLLTGYHPGTNRAVFLMLPRPHILQPTDRRTFVQGLRYIEGVQDFFLIVSHRKDLEGMCVEAFLETGHFPSDYRPPEPPVEYEESYEEFDVSAYASHGGWWGPIPQAGKKSQIQGEYTVQSEWMVDKRPNRKDGAKGDLGHPGIMEVADHSNQQARDTLKPYNYQANDATVLVTGQIQGSMNSGDGAVFRRTYRVLTHSVEAIPSTAVLYTPFFLTSRGLCTCFRWEKNCPKVLSVSAPGHKGLQWDSIVHESKIQMNGALLTKDVASQSRMPAMKELLRTIQSEIVTSWRRPSRRAYGQMGFLDTDYFKDRIRTLLPKEMLGRSLKSIKGLPPSVVTGLGEECTIDEALKLDLQSLMRKTGLTALKAAHARRTMLGIKPRPEASVAGKQPVPDSPKKTAEEPRNNQ